MIQCFSPGGRAHRNLETENLLGLKMPFFGSTAGTPSTAGLCGSGAALGAFPPRYRVVLHEVLRRYFPFTCRTLVIFLKNTTQILLLRFRTSHIPRCPGIRLKLLVVEPRRATDPKLPSLAPFQLLPFPLLS